MKKLLMIIFFLPVLALSQNSGIEVKLNNGKSIYTNYIFISSKYSNSFARINSQSGEKIPIDQIRYIQGTDRKGHQRYFDPIVIGSSKMWGERTFVSERIKIYSTSSFDLNNPAKAGDIYIKDNQKSKGLKYGNLKQDLSDNAVSLDYLKKANRIRTTQAILWTSSGIFFFAGVVQMFNQPLGAPEESLSIPPVFILATAVNLPAWLLESPKKHRFREALQNYK